MIVYDDSEYFKTVDFLYQLCIDDDNRRLILTNQIIINLVTSIEVCVERILKQYVNKYKQLNIQSQFIDDSLKKEHMKVIANKISIIKDHDHKIDNLKSLFQEVSEFLNDHSTFDIKIDTKFPKGKHGDVQIKKLFQRIGIEDIMSSMQIYSENESMLSDERCLIDINEFIQDLTYKRNIAIHENANLYSRISDTELNKFISVTKQILARTTNIVNLRLYTQMVKTRVYSPITTSQKKLINISSTFRFKEYVVTVF